MALGLPYDSPVVGRGGGDHRLDDRPLLRGLGPHGRPHRPFAGYSENAEHMLRVLDMHRQATAHIDEELVLADLLSAAQEAWDNACDLGERYGVRNSQASVLAPPAPSA